MKHLIVLCAFIKLYGLSILFLLYLRTEPQAIKSGQMFIFLQEGQDIRQRYADIKDRFFERLTAYDGQFYQDIAYYGYRRFPCHEDAQAGLPGNYAFFPLLPSVLWAASLFERWQLAAVILFNIVCSLSGALILWCIAKRLQIGPIIPLVLLFSFPTAVFQFFLYTESLFLLLTTAATFAALHSCWTAAGILGTFCGLCRPQGSLVTLLLLSEAFRSFKNQNRTRSRTSLLPFVASVGPLLGLAAFALINWIEIGNPLAFIEIQKHASRTYNASGIIDALLSMPFYSGPLLDWAAVVLVVPLTIVIWRHVPRPLSLYGTSLVVLPLLTGTILSMGRFMSVAFPYFLCAGRLLEGRRTLTYAIVAVSLVLQAVTAKNLMEWRFVG